MDRILPNLVYTLLILARSRLDLLCIIFVQICNRVTALDYFQYFVSSQPVENKWTEFDQFCMHITLILVRFRFGLLRIICSQFS